MSKRHRYRFGTSYLHRRLLQFSPWHGYWCTDGYEIWLVNLAPKVSHE